MKTLLVASMVAFAGTACLVAPAQAASVIIQSDSGGSYDDGDMQPRHHQQNWITNDDDDYVDDQDNRQWRRHDRHRRCHIELVKYWRNHHKVIEEVKVCN